MESAKVRANGALAPEEGKEGRQREPRHPPHEDTGLVPVTAINTPQVIYVKKQVFLLVPWYSGLTMLVLGL